MKYFRPLQAGNNRYQLALIAIVAYVPLLFNDVGRIAADTKAYLYIEPGRLLERAPFMWQPEVAMGTVTHQNIGYLWPIGPFYWVADLIGLPDWLAQRLWLGSVLLAAGLGVRWLLRTLGWQGGGVLVASFAYMLSPYLLNYVDRHSVILLPWAGLPWLIGLTQRASRTLGWRHAAAFGLVTATIGGVNASSLLLVGLGPAAWLLWSGFEGSLPWKRVAVTGGKIAAAFLATGVWWMVGIAVQATHGLPTLRLTENYRVISDAATAPELFRGLGYWYFYGQGRLGAWIEPATSYTRWALPLSFAIPLLALLAGAFVHFRHRGQVLMLIALGILVGIGAHPYEGPSILGWIFRELTLSDAGLALRSTPRALPLSVLGLAILLGAGATAIGSWRPKLENVVAGSLCLLLVANLSPLWQGQILGELVQRPETIPDYWTEAADYLESRDNGTRVLEIPGSDFAAYRWGNSGDPVLPGLIDRPTVSRELIPQGTPAAAALLVSLDTEIQEGRLDPAALAPLARLMGAGDLVLRSDLQFERFRTPRPPDLWAKVSTSTGLLPPTIFGLRKPNVAGPERPLIDQHTLSRPPDAAIPPPVAVFPVTDSVKILRTADPERPIVLSGDADGIVAAAGAGLLEAGRPLLLSGTFADQPGALAGLLRPGTRIILTDSNRKDGHRWGSIRETAGYTERADEFPAEVDLSVHNLTVLPDRPGLQTVAIQTGIKVDASAYGNPVTFTPGDRPFHAVDGDPSTAWSVGAFNDVAGEYLVLSFNDPKAISAIVVSQARLQGQNRWISKLGITLNGIQRLVVELKDSSRSPAGQRLELPAVGPVTNLVLEILETDVGSLADYAGITGVGFAEVKVEGVVADETFRLPTELVDTMRSSVDPGADFAVLLTRQRSDPRDPIRPEPERSLDRSFRLPWQRSFQLTGQARLSSHAQDSVFDEILGAGAEATGSLAGDLSSRARAAFDDDLATAWQPPIGAQGGHTVSLDAGEEREFSELSLTVRADGLHSVPKVVTVLIDGRPANTHSLEIDLYDRNDDLSDGLVTVSINVDSVLGRSIALRIDEVTERRTMNWYSGLPDILPVAVVELNDGYVAVDTPAEMPPDCREDLLWLDGSALPVRLAGTVEDARSRNVIEITGCGPGIELGVGDHRIKAAPGLTTGIDIDRVQLRSEALTDVDNSPLPLLSLRDSGRTFLTGSANHFNSSFWLVLGQSHSSGWDLTVEGATAVSTPTLVDGFANGWLVTPHGEEPVQFSIRWTPQALVWFGLLAAVVAIAMCLVLAACGTRYAEPPLAQQPALRNPLVPLAQTGSTGSSLAAGAVISVFCALNLPSLYPVAVLIGVVSCGALLGRLPGRATTLLAVAFMGSAASLIAIDQIRFRYPRDFVWPLFFDKYHVLGVVAVLLIAAAAIEALLEHRRYQDGRVANPKGY